MSGPPPEPIFVRVLAALAHVREHVDAIEHDVLQMVRDAGASWEEIGEELGISRQAARRRFEHARRRQRRPPPD